MGCSGSDFEGFATADFRTSAGSSIRFTNAPQMTNGIISPGITANGNDYAQVLNALATLDAVDPADRRPVALIGKTVKGYWPVVASGAQ